MNWGILMVLSGIPKTVMIMKSEGKRIPTVTWLVKSVMGVGVTFWVGPFVVFLLIFCSLFVANLQNRANDGITDQLGILSNLAYKGNTNISYPSCSVEKSTETSIQLRLYSLIIIFVRHWFISTNVLHSIVWINGL